MLKVQNTITDLSLCMQRKLQDIVEQEECDVDSMWNKFKKCAMNSAREVLGEKMPYRGNEKRTPWCGEEVKLSVRFKMEELRKWMKSRSTEDRRNYVMARNEAQRMKRDAKEECWRRIGDDLKADFRGIRKLIYSLANGYRRKRQFVNYAIKDRNAMLLTDSEEIAERWREYFVTC